MKTKTGIATLCILGALLQILALPGYVLCASPIKIESRLELFVDDYLIESLNGGARLELHHPIPQEIVMVHDAPWEGSGTGYHTIFRDGDIFRMYYKAWDLTITDGKLGPAHPTFGAYAESRDGFTWTKPSLGLFEYKGSKANNIIWDGPGAHDFTPFRDSNPSCRPEERYKAVASGAGFGEGLLAFTSPDGIHWKMLQKEPIITDGAFDTQNLAFYDEIRKEYRTYIRDFKNGIRGIKTATSRDFIHWTKPEWLTYPEAPEEQLYTNQVKPYYRAPHIFIGFPTRYTEREWTEQIQFLPEYEHRQMRAAASQRYGSAITDALFMSSRDGLTFKRWGEAFLRPGLREKENWAYGDNYIAWHLIETPSRIEHSPNELSLYATESYWTENSSKLRRYTLRIDGFVSVNAPLTGGELVTKPFSFTGDKLVLNFSTSGAGSIRVEIQDEAGRAIAGYGLEDCPEIFGDDLERIVYWKNGTDIRGLSDKSIRLRFVMKDADLYSIQFRE